MIRIGLAFSILAFVVVAGAVPVSVAVKADQGSLEFHAVGRPSMIKINGTGRGPEGVLTVDGKKVAGDLTFDMTSLNSGISMRDTHMKEKYLEVQKYPTSKLHLTDVSLPDGWSPAHPDVKDRPFKGDLTLHGVTKPITGTFDIVGGAKVAATASFEAKIDDYGIDIPKYLGITVKNEVPVKLQMNDLKLTK